MLSFLILAAQDAHSAGEHAIHSDVIDTANWLPAVTSLVVFGLVLVALYAKVWPLIMKGLDEREQKLRSEILAAEQSREQAKAALAQYERSLATAREEAAQMIAKAKNDAKAVADELRNRNQTELAEMKVRAMRDIESAKQAAISELHVEATNLAISIASKILAREISPSDQKKMIDDSLHELVKAGNG